MFKRLPTARAFEACTVSLDGREVVARAGDTVAAVLLLEHVEPYRLTAISNTPRSPFCMMGTCFDCLVEIDGVANCQACLIKVKPGMKIRRSMGLRTLAGI